MNKSNNIQIFPSIISARIFSALLILLLFAAGFIPGRANSAEGDALESYPYQHILTGKQQAGAVAVDPAGYIIIGGSTLDDFLTVKVKADGSAKLWEKTFDLNGGIDHLEAVAVDSNGDVIVTGYASEGVNGLKDIITIKYDGTDGTVLWQVSYNNPDNNGDDFPFALTVDSLNNIYIAGKTQGSGGDDDGLLLKYSPNGANPDDTPIWVTTYDGSGTVRNDQWTSVTAGTNGIAVTGKTDVAAADPANFNIVTMLYNQDGTYGWVSPVVYDSGFDGDSGIIVRMDSGNNVIVTGISGANGGDYYTVKYSNANGSIDTGWGTAKTYDGGNIDQPKGLWIDGNDDVYVTGSTFIGSSTDYYTIRYNGSDGNSIWGGGVIYNSGLDQSDIPVGIVVDDTGDVFVTGYSIISGTNYDFTTLKYKKDNGTQLWIPPVGVYSGTAGKIDQPLGLGLASSGELFVGGFTDTAANDYDFVAIKYDPGNLNSPTSLEATTVSNTAIDLTWTDNSNNESGFKIFRKKASDLDFTEIDTVPANATTTATYADSTGLTPHIWYTYKVQAYITSPAAISHFSNDANALTTAVSYDTPTWTYLYNSADNGEDYAYAIAIGPDNDPVATGTHQPGIFPAPVSFDYYTIKMNHTNAAMIWDATYDDADWQLDIADCITVDNNNDVVVSGFSNLPWGNNPNTNDIYTRKYLSTGPDNGPPNFGDPFIWSAQYNGPANDDDRSEAIDASSDNDNNVVVTGYGKNIRAEDDIYVIKYDAPGDGLGEGNTLWAATPYDGGGNDYPTAVTFDQNGDVFITGKTFLNGNYDVFTRKIDGLDGSTIWTMTYNGSGNGDDAGNSLAVDSNGDVYVTGYTTNGSANLDWYIVKYDGDAPGPNSVILWSDTHDGPANGEDIAESIKVDQNDDAVVIGGTVLQSVGNNDFHVRRYTTGGNPDWNKTLERVGNDDNATTMGMDVSGNVCLAGNTDDADSIDLLAVKYDYDGNILGSTLYNGVDDTDAYAMAVNTVGDQFIAGYTTPRLNLDSDFLVVKCMGDVLQSPSPVTPTVHYTSVDFNWVDNTSDEDGFHLERKVGSCTSVDWNTGSNLIHTAAADATSYTNEGLNIGSTYCYRIQTFKNSGAVSRWIEKEVTTTTPLPPNGLSAFILNTTDIKLQWNDTTSTEDGFTIERCTGAGCDPAVGPNKKTFDIAANATSFTDITGCYGITYNYHIKAYRTGKWSTLFVAFAADLTTDNLSPPTSLLLKTVFNQKTIHLEWDDNSNDETSFVIERCNGTALECGDTKTFTDIHTINTIYGNTMLLGMNEASWNNTPDQILDDSGNNNHATSGGNPTTGDNGIYDRRGQLDGNGDYLTTSLIIDQADTSPGATMMAWVYPSTISADNHYLFSTENGGAGSENYNWGVYRNAGIWYVDTGAAGVSTGIAVTAGQWQHIAVVFDPAGIKFYKDGNLTSMAAPANNDTSQPFTIGKNGILNQEYFDGYLDEVAVYDRPLPQSQVQTLMNNSVFESGKANYADSSAIEYQNFYTYRIRAEKSTDASCSWNPIPSNELEINTLPPPPTDLVATALDSTRVGLSWTDNTEGEDSFTLERCEIASCTFSSVSDTIPGNTTSYMDTTACGTIDYRYRIKAVKNATWTSLPSNTDDATTLAKGEAVTAFAKTTQFEEQVDLEWTYNATDLTGFKIGRCIGPPDPSAGTCDVASDPAGDYGYTGSPLTSVSALPSGAIAWFSFEDARYEGNINDVFDSSGSGNHGTTVNIPTKLTPGKYGNSAIEFNGVNDYINTTIDIDQDSSASAGITFEAWVYPTVNNSTWKYIFSTEQTVNRYNWGLFYLNNRWYVTNGNTTWNPTTLTYNTWQHVVVVFEPGVGTRFYVNGQEFTTTSIGYDAADATLTIGREGSRDSRYFQGALDEVVIYNRPLTKQEVLDRRDRKIRFPIEGLSSNTAYNFIIWPYKTVTCGWDGPLSTVVSTTTDDITAIFPTNFTHTFYNTTLVDLSWDDIASSETGYQIQRCNGSCIQTDLGDYTALNQFLGADTTVYSDPSLCQGQTYTYRVRATGTVGGDSLWAYHEITTAPATEPGITLDVVSESEINISWGDFTPDEEQYTLKRCQGSGTACDGIPDTEFDVLLTTESGSMPGVSSLHYRMDEAAWANGATDVVDISGNSRHGQPYNNATTIEAGKYDRAGEFNGSNHYIDTPLNIDQSATSNGVTFEAWVYPTVTNSTWKYLIGTDNDSLSSGYDWSVFYLNSTWYVTNGVTTWNAGTITLNDWQHIAVVFEPGVGVRFYKNGVQNSSTQIGYDTNDSTVTIGRRGSVNQQYFQGYIDEVVIYERPLSQSEATEHFTNQAAKYGYADTGLTAGTFYTYRVQSVKTAPTCNWTIETLDTVQTIPPPPPTNLQVGGNTTIASLTWDDNSGSEDNYHVQRCPGDCDPDVDTGWVTLRNDLGEGTELYDDETVCPGIFYSYRVRAEDSVWNTTTWASVRNKLIPSPITPSGLNFDKISEVQVNLDWTDVNNDHSGFTIEQCAGASCPTTGIKKNLIVSPDVTTYQAIELTPDQSKYTFRIRADKASASCGWPTAYSAEVTTDTIPFVPITLSGSSVDTTTIDLTWTGGTASETGTTILRCDTPTLCAGVYSPVGKSVPGATSFTDSTVCNGQTYEYVIKAVGEGLSNDGGGCWTKKAPLTFTNGFIANTAVQIIIPYATFAADMQADYSDIRFYDATAKQNLTSFWFTSKQDGVTATVWLLTGNHDDIYMYYGNISAPDASTTEVDFTKAYDLTGTVIRTEDWVEIEVPARNDIRQNNGISFVLGSNGYNKGLISTETFGRGAGNEIYVDLTTGGYAGSGGDYAAFGWAKDQTASPSNTQMMHGIEFYGANRQHARFRIYENGIAVNIPNPYQRYSTYTRYELKIILKEPGAQYYVKGGVYVDWTLLYETSIDFAGDETMRVAMLHSSLQLTINGVAVKSASNQHDVSAGIGVDVATCTGDFNIWESLYNDNGPVPVSSDNFVDPDNLVLTVTSDTSVYLSWNSANTDESGFKIERCLDTGSGCSFIEIDTTGKGITTFSDTTVPASATVSYQVKAYKTTPYCTWTSGPSNAPLVILASSAPTGPDTPSVLKVTPLNSFSLQLDWTDNGSDEEGYEIEVLTFNGMYANIAVLGENKETYVDSKVEPGKTYHYQVRSFRGNTKSSWLKGSGTTPTWSEGDSTNTCYP